MAGRWGPMHKCGIKECPNQTVNPICPQCKSYFKQAGERPHTWRLEMRTRYQRLDSRLARVDSANGGGVVVHLHRQRRA